MRRLGVLAVLIALACSACGSGGSSGSGGSGGPAHAPTTADTATGFASSTATDQTDELIGKLAANAPPTNVGWGVPASIPTGWTQLHAEAGTLQWRVGTTACAVTLEQPAGLGTAEEPDSDRVATDYVAMTMRAMHATAKLQPITHRMVTEDVNDGALQAMARMSVVHFTAAGGIEGVANGYRAGDFALRATALCGKGDYAANGSAMESFLSTLAIRTTY